MGIIYGLHDRITLSNFVGNRNYIIKITHIVDDKLDIAASPI